MPQNYKWTIRLGLLSLPLFVVAVLLGGGGHGSFIPLIIFFPFAVVSTAFFEGGVIAFLLALGQLFFYGWMIDKVQNPKKRERLVRILMVIHIAISYGVWAWWSRKNGGM